MCKSIAMHGTTSRCRILNDKRLNKRYNQNNIKIPHSYCRLGGDTAAAGERDGRHDMSQL